MKKKLYAIAFIFLGFCSCSLKSMEEINENQSLRQFYGPKNQENIINLLNKKYENKTDIEDIIEKYFQQNESLAKNNDFKLDPYDVSSDSCSFLYYLVLKRQFFSLGEKLINNGAQPKDEFEAFIILGAYISTGNSLGGKGVYYFLKQNKNLIFKKIHLNSVETKNLWQIAQNYKNTEAMNTMSLLLSNNVYKQ